VMSSANAVLESASAAPIASPMSLSDFMRVPRGDRFGGERPKASLHPRQLILQRNHRYLRVTVADFALACQIGLGVVLRNA
jgi:hypothetical protein